MTTLRSIGSWTLYAIVFGLVLELCARIDDGIKYEAPFIGKYTNERLRGTDDEGIRYNIPNGNFEKWRNNNLGFRGRDLIKDKPAGTTRIVCMGTSETYGLYEDPDNEWPAQLSRMIQDHDSLEVINAATVGLKRKHVPRYLEKHVYELDPDVVVVLLSPSFIDRDQVADGQAPQKETVVSAQTPTDKLTLSTIKQRIRIFPKAWQVVKQFVPQRLLEQYQYRDRANLIDDMERRYLKGKPPLDEVPPENLDRFESELLAIVNDLHSRGIKVVLCTYPYLLNESNLETYPLIFMENRRFTVELSYVGMVDASYQANRLVRKVAENENTGFIDLYSLVPQNTTYFADNVHYTDAGAEVVARAVASFLLTR